MPRAAAPKTPHPRKAAVAIRAGIGGWTFAPWRGSFYPESLAQRLELEYASRKLRTIEINGTFYGAQKPATYARWRGETPAGFVFSLKAPRYATSRKRLAEAGASIDAFVRGGLAELGDRLGPINWQLPAGKAFDADDIAAFLDLLPARVDGLRLRHVLEVRDPSFACPAYVQLARERGIATAYTDSPDYPSIADVGADFVYLRLRCAKATVATGYPPRALAAWAERARVWGEGGRPDDLPCLVAAPKATPRDVFVYIINGAKERAPRAAMALQQRIDGR